MRRAVLETTNSICHTRDNKYKERLENLGFKCSAYFNDSFKILTDSIEIEMNTIEELMQFIKEVAPPSGCHYLGLDNAVIVGDGKIILYHGYIE